MKKMKRLSAFMLCAVMIAAFLPAGVSFADENSSAWKYTVTIATQDVNNAGSGDTIKFIGGIATYDSNGTVSSVNEVDIFTFTESVSRNSSITQSVYSDYAPWDFYTMGISCGTDNALCIQYVEVKVEPNSAKFGSHAAKEMTLISKDEGSALAGWIGGKQKYEEQTVFLFVTKMVKVSGHPLSVTMAVDFGSVLNDSLDDWLTNLSGTNVLNMTGEYGYIVAIWDGEINDQYMQGNYTYNIFDYSNSPQVSIEATAYGATSVDGKSTETFNLQSLEDGAGMEVYKTTSLGFEVDRAKLLQFMNENQINKITITSTVTIPYGRLNKDYTTRTLTATYTIIRGAFTIGEPQYPSTYSKPAEVNNYYYKAGTNGLIEVRVPILINKTNNDHINLNVNSSGTSSVLYSVAGRKLEFEYARLQLGSDEDLYVEPFGQDSVTIDENGIATFYFMLPGDCDSGDVGFTFILKRARISVPLTSKGGSLDFYLYNPSETPETGGSDDGLGNVGDISVFSEEYKLDRVTPTVEVSETADGGKFGEWTNSLTVSVTTSETLYNRYDVSYISGTNSDGSGIYSTDAGIFSQPQFSYSLKKLITDAEGNIVNTNYYAGYSYILNDGTAGTGDTSQTALAASGGDAKELTVALANAEEGKYILQITGKDRANNVVTHEVEDVWLDNKPPVVKMNISSPEVAVDGKLSQEYIFGVTDLSLTGKVYYYIDTVGNGPASDYTIGATAGIDETTGVMSTYYDQWVFLNQTDNYAETTDGAAVITLDPGEEFEGTIYYLAVDSCGNTTSTVSKPISLSNVSLDCTIDWTEIDNQKDYEITLDSSAGTSVSYRWLDQNQNPVTESQEYTGSVTASDAWGTDDAWDGYYYFEYTVTASVSGVSTSAKAAFFFDNSAPTITITDSDAGKYMSNHGLNIAISDNAIISEATAQFYRADGTEVGEEISLIDADSNGKYSINENLLFGPEDGIVSGAYKPKVYAVDENGNESESESSLIHIRKEAPTVEVTAEADAVYGVNNAPLVMKDGEYTVTVSVSEAFVNPELVMLEINEKQYAYYRITDGSSTNPGVWNFLGELTAEEVTSEFKGTFTITNPTELVEGENIVTIETIIVTAGRSVYPNDDVETLGNEAVRIGRGSFTIYLDETAPSYSLTLEDEYTVGNIVGKLKLYDKYSTDFTVEASDDAVALELVEREYYDEEATEEETDTGNTENTNEFVEYTAVYTVTVTDNTDSTITVKDKVGNTITIPVKVERIDREAPVAEMTNFDYTQSGERTDAEATVKVSDMMRGSFRVAVIPADELADAIEEGTIDNKYFGDYSDMVTYSVYSEVKTLVDNEVTAEYYIKLAGNDGDYYIGVRAEDTLGNTSDTVFDEKFTIVNAEPVLTLESVSPKAAGTKALAKVTSNVPIYIMPSEFVVDTAGDADSVEEANLQLAESYADYFYEEYSLVITESGELTFYVVDDLGRSYAVTLNVTDDDVTFGNDLTEPIVTRFNYVETYAWGRGDLISSEIIEVADDEYIAGYSNWTYPDDVDGYCEMSPMISIEAVPLADGTETYLMPFSGDWDDSAEYSGMTFKRDMSEEGAYGYTKMVYSIDWYDADVRSMQIYVTTEERYQYGASDWDIADILVEKVDSSEPVVTAVYNPQSNDPYNDEGAAYTHDDVVVDVYMSDPQTGLDCIEISGYNSETWEEIELTILLTDEDGNAIDYYANPYTYTSELVDLELYSDTDIRSVKRLRMTIHNNSYFNVNPYNTLGIEGWLWSEGIYVDNIMRTPLSEDEYTLTYYYLDNNGDWQLVPDGDDTTYFKKGKAVITPTDSGNYRELYVYNNGGEWEKELDIMQNSYTFKLKDRYGYVLNVTAELTRFDETPGTITYTLGSRASDNSAPLTITAYDAQSGVGSVTLTHGGIEETLTETSIDEDGVYTYNKNLTTSGTYTITLTDKVGNVERKVFSVSSIDTEAPEIAKVSYSTQKLTASSVTAAITYTKSNVTLKSVTPVQDDFDYRVNYSTSVIEFYENGTLTVTFEDAYGNEGFGTVGVSWIYTIPPSLEAVCEVADDCQSVAVTFIKATDDNGVPIDQERELTDITVYYAGNAQRVQSVDEDGNVVDAKYTFVKNGEYTFAAYDDEGTTSYLTVKIEGIDTSAPVVTQVLWTYNYDKLNDSGEWETMQVVNNEWTPDDEDGYRIYVDDDNPITKYDVNVTIVTDVEATIAGKTDYESTTEHTVTYDSNGTYMFNFKKPNGTTTSYGFDVEVIDKTAPVIELEQTELIFYENEQMNTPYSRDMIDKCFTAYDVFRDTITDLTEKVTIDYGDFDPTKITNNTYDRTKPYTITYTVTDDANNTTQAKMMVRLVGLTDTIVLVNGDLPDSANRSYVKGEDTLTLTLKNFSGIAYAKVAYGTWSMGKMKSQGTVIEQTLDENGNGTGEFTYTVPKEGWYTILIQTDKRDYFNLQIAVENID
ncbi:MAG: hypothetical protein LUG52_07250 [Clostridia bacterium]|nr:hypothetical protein [Clostridia bacterium]